MAYLTNKFCWHGVITTNVDTAVSFYTKTLGWSAMTVPMGDDQSTMFAAADIPRAHVSLPPMEGVPSHWDNYLRVEDVDAATAASTANGGAVVVPPTDIPVGRFSAVSSPSGAMVCLFHEADEATAENAPAGPGAIHWTELHSQDLDSDLAWLKATFGYATSEMPMPDGTYHILQHDGARAGGAMKSAVQGAPSFWLSWVEVEDVDATLVRAAQHGGHVMMPAADMPGVGRMAVVTDPTGASFGVITPDRG